MLISCSVDPSPQSASHEEAMSWVSLSPLLVITERITGDMWIGGVPPSPSALALSYIQGKGCHTFRGSLFTGHSLLLLIMIPPLSYSIPSYRLGFISGMVPSCPASWDSGSSPSSQESYSYLFLGPWIIVGGPPLDIKVNDSH